MYFFIVALLLISQTSHADSQSNLELDDIRVTVIGDGNRSQLSIGSTDQALDKVTVLCKSIEQRLIGKNSMLTPVQN